MSQPVSDLALEYRRLVEFCEANCGAVPDSFKQISIEWSGEVRAAYEGLLDNIPVPLAGLRVLDFGCKFGHLAPMVLARGAKSYIGVDAEREYVETADHIMRRLYPKTEFHLTEAGLVPLQPGTADLVIMNEVISHVNPAYLDLVWSETARILSPGGSLFISDGNNSANPAAARKLIELYDKWENGPEGAKTDRDVVRRPFLVRRREIIIERAPGLASTEVEELARNTSGLFGEGLIRAIDDYVRSRRLVSRPYRRGMCPVNPGSFGVVMERGFHPVQLELWLAEYGLEARQLEPEGSFARGGVLGPAKSLYAFLRYHIRRLVDPQWYRAAYEGFQMVAKKRE
jgi:SAM-dependent methyltransferase